MGESSGVKDDDGKDPWHLIEWGALQEAAKVLAYGADKYSPRNWESGLLYSRYFSATIRHLTAWWRGEDLDSETRLHHLAHALCCVMFLLAYSLRNRHDIDDRPTTLRPGPNHESKK